MPGTAFVGDEDRVLADADPATIEALVRRGEAPASFEVAGPRRNLFFDPSRVRAGIVTCGGLCPGINDVIRAIVMSLWHHYGVRTIKGFRFGYEGLVARYSHEPIDLTADCVTDIHKTGGSIL